MLFDLDGSAALFVPTAVELYHTVTWIAIWFGVAIILGAVWVLLRVAHGFFQGERE